jgi:hypothetical protein
VLSSSPEVPVDGIPDGNQIRWTFPADLSGPVEVDIDLRFEHPYPVRGLQLLWDSAFLPLGYEVQYAGNDQLYQSADVTDLSNIVLPDGGSFIPVPARFTQTDSGVEIRFVRLIFPEGTFPEQAVLEELRFDYDRGPGEDAEDNPTDTMSLPDCGVAYAEPSVLWPPSHTFREVRIMGLEEQAPTAITVAAVTQDEPTLGLGDGDFGPDAYAQESNVIMLRAERSGESNGRVYVVQFVAQYETGEQCRSSVEVKVPHHIGMPAVNDFLEYDSLAMP